MKTVSFKSQSGSPQTAEWHSWRLKGIGGSDVIILAAEEGIVKPPTWVKNSRWLWEVKTGRRSGDIPGNAAMKRGTENEGPARARFIKESGISVSPMFGENETRPFIRASFDGIDFSQTAVCEIKVPSEDRHMAAKRGEVPEYYLCQMAHQALVVWEHPDNFDGKNFFYVSYHPETKDIAIIDTVNYGGFDEPLVSCLKPLAEKLVYIEQAFWDSVKNDTMPCGTEWMAAAHEWLAADQELDLWKKKLDLSKDRLVKLLGDRTKEVGGGISMSRSFKKGSIDYAALLKDKLPDLSDEEIEKFRKDSKTESFTIRKAAD